MIEIAHPEVLARDWLPPLAFGREREVADLLRRLDPPEPRAPRPWIVGVVGPSGSGTSLVARRAAREVADRVRASRAGVAPRVIAARVAGQRGLHGVASVLLRHLDEGFDGRGFAVTEILAGFLRRIRREGRPLVLVLDDVQVGSPELAPLLRAIGDPDRFLPEGEYGLPPVWTVVAGTFEGWESATASLPGTFHLGAPIPLAPYTGRALAVVVRDRAERALGHPPTESFVADTVERALEDGGGARRAIDLARRALVAAGVRSGTARGALGVRSELVEIEPRVVRAIEVAAQNREARVGEVRRFEAELARSQGDRPLPATTLWRRIVRLERAGYVRRDIRPGGVGGTQSIVRVLTPVDEWITTSRRPETRPTDGPWTEFPSSEEGSAPGAGSPSPDLRPPSDLTG